MKRCLIALIVAVLSLTTGVGLATAAVPSVGTQTAGQSATSGQAAGAAAGAAQTDPNNTNVTIRVLSPGNDGSVSQSNSVDSNATASNRNSADQDATQAQSAGSTGACCGSGSTGIQSANQSAGNQQLAAALSYATQTGASNTNAPVRVGSDGTGGSVSQSNSADSDATARNGNAADQDATQTQSSGGGACCQSGSTGVQTADQTAENQQAAAAESSAKQDHPKNTNVDIRVLSPGNGGNVTQENTVSSNANAHNSNDADQTATQTQSGSGSSDCKCHDGSTGIQTADQDAKNEQTAVAKSEAEQKGASNINASIRVLSPGNDGNVSQSNSVDSDARASNRNSADQDATQTQGSGSGSGTGIQVADQDAKSSQAAAAASSAKQDHPTNINTPIRVLSPGNGGNVVQSNSVESDASAYNSNDADQTATQTQRGGGSSDCKCHDGSTGIQTADQSAKNEQLAIGLSAAEQKGAKNSNSPIRVGSYGNDGDVWQTNSVDSDAKASNKNSADQDATQTQSAGSGSGTGIQVADQSSKNGQAALAASIATQDHAKNDNSPIRVLSPGNGGKVVQTNSVESDAKAKNSNDVDQTATQTQSGSGSSGCKCHDGSDGHPDRRPVREERADRARFLGR